MTETEHAQPGRSRRSGAQADHPPDGDSVVSGHFAADDPLAAALLSAQRLLRRVDVEPDVRMRLHLRYAAICTSLKMPTASRVRGAERLQRLIADVTAAGRRQASGR